MAKPIHIMLADDDSDDRFFFDLALKEVPFETTLITADNGENAMLVLAKNHKHLPDVLFLDMNMPRKNGAECLTEIKRDPKLKNMHVIIYSTSLHEDVADDLYKAGACCYIQKTDVQELVVILTHIVKLISDNNFKHPERADFILRIDNLQHT